MENLDRRPTSEMNCLTTSTANSGCEDEDNCYLWILCEINDVASKLLISKIKKKPLLNKKDKSSENQELNPVFFS